MHPELAHTMVRHHMTTLVDAADARRASRPRRRSLLKKG
jgi:hypothetical protein